MENLDLHSWRLPGKARKGVLNAKGAKRLPDSFKPVDRNSGDEINCKDARERFHESICSLGCARLTRRDRRRGHWR